MCNRYGYLAPVSRLEGEFSQIRRPLRWADGLIPNLEPLDEIKPTNRAPILRPVDPADPSAGLELVKLRWWLVPFFHRKTVKEWKPICTNARVETIDTAASYRDAYKARRAIVPATHFFEWTPVDPEKPKGAKRKWRISAPGRDVFYFAGLWDRATCAGEEGPVESFTIATCEPGADVEPYHTRQPVILDAEAAAAWLDLGGPGKALLRPSDPGTLVLREEVGVEAAA
jgi:putative SOS response-associated peptidase YedK